MQLRNMLLVGLFSVTILSGCSWFNSEKDVVTISPLPQVETQFTPTVVWKIKVGHGIGEYYSHLRPAAQNNIIYAADRQGLLKALTAEDGKEIWSVNLNQSGFFSSSRSTLLSGGLTVSGDKIYIGSENAVVYALYTKDGSEAWKTTVAGEAISRPVVSDGLVLIHTTNGMLQALDESNGVIKWTVNLDIPSLTLRGESTPTTTYGAAIVGGDNGRVSAILMEKGQLIWQQRISEPSGATDIDRLSDVDTTPIVVGEVVYAVGYNGNLVALNLRDGQMIWKHEMGSGDNFIIDQNHIYAVDQEDRVVALNITGGTVLWEQTALLHREVTAPVLYQGYLVVGDVEGYLHWINPRDGHFVAQQKIDSSGLLSESLVADNKLIVQSRGGTVYAITH